MRLVFGLHRAAVLAATAAALVSAATPAVAQRRDTGFDLTQLDVSARTAALAGAQGGFAGTDPTALFSNPAFLTGEMSRSAAFGYVNHLADVSAGTALYARALPRLGVDAAVGVRYLSYGSFERAGGTESGTFGASEAAITLAASRVVAPNVRVGASAHALFATIDDASAQALTADIGATFEVPSQRLVVGASVSGVGTVLSSLGAVDDRLPLDVRVSVAKRLRYIPLTVTLTGYELQSYSQPARAPGVPDSLAERESALEQALDRVLIGGELQLGRALTTRLGYSPRRGRAVRGDGRLDLAGLSAGFGLAVRRFALDYAFTGWSESGAVHQIGVRTRL